MRRKKAELLGGPWHRGPSIRGFGDVIPGARSGAGRPSWILASSVSRPFSIKPAGLATFHYDNKIYRIWGLEGEKEREGGTHHDAQNATGGERGWMAYLGDHTAAVVGRVCMGEGGIKSGKETCILHSHL